MFGFGSFIETGAHVGTTTEMLAGLDRPVHSCELNRRIYLRAALRLASYANVTLADPGYGFDRYANGNELTLDFLLPRLTCQRRLAFLAPSAAAASESGAKRGTLVVVPAESYVAALADAPLLQLLTVRES